MPTNLTLGDECMADLEVIRKQLAANRPAPKDRAPTVTDAVRHAAGDRGRPRPGREAVRLEHTAH